MLPSVARAKTVASIEVTYSLMPLYQFCRSRKATEASQALADNRSMSLNGGYLQAPYPNFVMMSCPEIV